ncbi:MAG: hypothetical protein JXA83_16445 [Acidimicrobiales bacterium]|nr:hypothetical protein [Acidimicrobiales bacterium]
MTVTTVDHVRGVLAAQGFADELVAEGAHLRASSSGETYDPADLVVARLVRFEGITVPDPAGMLFALGTADGQPLGTYAPPYRPHVAAEDAAIVEQLHEKVRAGERARRHTAHDHVAAIFDARSAAQAAVDELGLGDDQLGVAVREGAPRAFERDAESELEHDAGIGTAAGAAIGFLAGMSIAAIALVPGGVLGLGGILAAGAGSGLGGAMLGGYLGIGHDNRAFDERDELSSVPLEPGQVLVVVCSHGHATAVETLLERHGGELLLRPQAD